MHIASYVGTICVHMYVIHVLWLWMHVMLLCMYVYVLYMQAYAVNTSYEFCTFPSKFSDTCTHPTTHIQCYITTYYYWQHHCYTQHPLPSIM